MQLILAIVITELFLFNNIYFRGGSGAFKMSSQKPKRKVHMRHHGRRGDPFQPIIQPAAVQALGASRSFSLSAAASFLPPASHPKITALCTETA